MCRGVLLQRNAVAQFFGERHLSDALDCQFLLEESSVRVVAPHDALQNSSVAITNLHFGWLVAIVVECGDTPAFETNRVTVLGKVNNGRKLGNAGARMGLRVIVMTLVFRPC